MILHPDMGDDVLSLSMFWAGLMMVFTPIIAAGVVIFVWRRGLRKAAAAMRGVNTISRPAQNMLNESTSSDMSGCSIIGGGTG